MPTLEGAEICRQGRNDPTLLRLICSLTSQLWPGLLNWGTLREVVFLKGLSLPLTCSVSENAVFWM